MIIRTKCGGLHSNSIEILIGDLVIPYVRSLCYHAGVDEFPTAEINLFALSDQMFEVVNQHCHIKVESPILGDIPAKPLKRELESRGWKVSQ